MLPFRYKGKLLFCLCRSFSTDRRTDEDSAHETVAEGALTGTWVLHEVILVVLKGYEVIKFINVYVYEVKQTYRGGLFV